MEHRREDVQQRGEDAEPRPHALARAGARARGQLAPAFPSTGRISRACGEAGSVSTLSSSK